MTRNEILKTAKPILFNTDMVRAILDGRKTVTRRPIKFPVGRDGKLPNCNDIIPNKTDLFDDKKAGFKILPFFHCNIKIPYSRNDILYVRETWGIYTESYMDADYVLYRADYPDNAKTYDFDGVICDLPKWRPSIHMPKEAARIFLRVTDVRVERLQNITNDEAIREGFTEFPTEPAIVGFVEEWDETVKKADLDKYGWDANPWVWAIEFERLEVE